MGTLNAERFLTVVLEESPRPASSAAARFRSNRRCGTVVFETLGDRGREELAAWAAEMGFAVGASAQGSFVTRDPERVLELFACALRIE